MFRTIKRMWRLVLGMSFLCSGAAYLNESRTSAIATMAIGAGFLIWHIVYLIQSNKQR